MRRQLRNNGFPVVMPPLVGGGKRRQGGIFFIAVVITLLTAAYFCESVEPKQSSLGYKGCIRYYNSPFLLAQNKLTIMVDPSDNMNKQVFLRAPKPLYFHSPKNMAPPTPKGKTVSFTIGKKAERLYHPIILKAADQYNVDAALIKAIIFAESGYNSQAVSKKGAKGLMQLMPKTAESLGVDDCFNPEQNIFGGVKYFKKLSAYFKGDINLAIAAYNSGIQAILKHQGIPPFKSTRHYLAKVLKYYQIYKNRMERA